MSRRSSGGGAGAFSSVTLPVSIANGGTGQTTATAAFDALAPSSPAQGDITYYNGTHWVKLTAGTSGYVLQTQGGSANPQWASPGTATNSLFLTPFTAPPAAAGFTHVNFGASTTIADDRGTLFFRDLEENTGGRTLAVVTAPATPYKFTILCSPDIYPDASCGVGIVARESSTGKFANMYFFFNSSGQLQTEYWTDATTNQSVPGAATTVALSPWIWMQIEDDGTNLTFRWSYDTPNADGKLTLVHFTAARTAFMAGGPNQIGIICHAQGTTATHVVTNRVYSWTAA